MPVMRGRGYKPDMPEHVCKSAFIQVGALVFAAPALAAEGRSFEPMPAVMAILALAIAGYFICRIRWWLVLGTLPLALGYVVPTVLRIHNPAIAAQIESSGGRTYYLVVYGLSVLVVASHAAGAWLGWKRPFLK